VQREAIAELDDVGVEGGGEGGGPRLGSGGGDIEFGDGATEEGVAHNAAAEVGG
jgi:hypothetical protein